MSDTTFTNGVTLTDADWFNDVNRLHYTIFSDPADAAAVRTAVSVPSKAEIQNGTQVTLSSVAGTNTITASASPAPTAYASGQVFRFVPANTNSGATTLNINSLGAKNVYANNAACTGNELVQNVPATVFYDGTQFQILGGNVWQDKTQTLTNKTLSSPAISGTSTGTYTLGGTITLGSGTNITWGSNFTGFSARSLISTNSAAGSQILNIQDANRDSFVIFANGDGTSYNTANAVVWVRQASGTSRSINAAGSINASGADYAEYERKAPGCGNVPKGAVVGFDANGLVTDKWADAVTFGVKSTAPSYVGGDVWGRPEDVCPIDGNPIGERPTQPDDSATDDERAAYQAALTAWEARIDAARAAVDRIAYAGKVPVNVYGATPGQYIEAVQDGDGIKGAVSAGVGRTTVGRVRRVLADGRAEISVMIC